MAASSPAIPEPIGAGAPQPRPVWTAPDGLGALAAFDWADGHAPSYGVVARAAVGMPWRAASADQLWPVLDALGRWLDRAQAPM